MDQPSDAHCSGDNRPGGSSTCTVNHWSAQRHSCCGQAEHACNTPSLGTRPVARQQHKAHATRMHAQEAPAPAAPQPTSTGPAQQRSVSHCSRDNRPDRDHLQAQCFTGLPSDTPAVETTGKAEHACNTLSSGTCPEAWQQPKTYATRMHAPAAPASAAPQNSSVEPSTGPAQRRSVSLTAAETTGLAEDDLCPAQLGYTPLRPLYPQRQSPLSAGRPSNTYYSGDNQPSRQ